MPVRDISFNPIIIDPGIPVRDFQSPCYDFRNLQNGEIVGFLK